MAEIPVIKLNDLFLQFRDGTIDRRQFMVRATGLGLSAATVSQLFRGLPAAAQDATPAAGTGQVINSVSREDFAQALFAKYPKDPNATKGGQIIMGDSTDLETLNPLLVSSSPTSYFVGLIFESLVSTNPIDGSIVPGIADRYEIAGDNVTYTFYLNPTIKFHDGTPLTAEDVKFSLDTILNPEFNTQFRDQILGVLDTYRVVDDHTFEMKSKGPVASFLYDGVGPILVVPKHLWENVAVKDWPADKGSTGEDPSRVIGSGPFTFKGREIGVSATAVRNDAYWDLVTGQVPNIDSFVYQVLPDDSAAVQALIAGDTDILETIPAPQTVDVQNTPGRKVDVYPTLNFTFYAYQLNPDRSKLFLQKEVRQALFFALDRQAIVDTIYAGFGEVAEGTQSILSPAYAPDRMTTHYTYDPDKAKQLLDSAGWTAGGDGVREKDGVKLSFKMLIPEGSTSDSLAAYFQQAWSDVGADMQPDIRPFDVVIGDNGPLDQRDFDTFLLGFGWVADPGQGTMFKTGGGFNYEDYSNPDYDKLEEEQLRELDPEKRIELIIQQSNIVNDDLPVGIFRFAVGRTGYNDRVKVFYPTAYSLLWTIPFSYVASS